MGYFIEFGNDVETPSFLPSNAQRWRWRLKEIRQPSESLQIFNLTSSSAWIQQLVSSQATTPVLADNVIALIFVPERTPTGMGSPLSSDFHYDSRDSTSPLTRNQLPVRLRVALVVMDEPSAQILAAQNGTNPPTVVSPDLFQKAEQLDTDLTILDGTLTSQKIRHRLFQREILLTSAVWSNTPSE